MADKTIHKHPKPKKVFDITSPGKTTANATSRPVIVGHKPTVKDPVVTGNDASHSKTAPLLTRKRSTVVKEPSASADSALVPAKTAPAATPANEQSAPPVADTPSVAPADTAASAPVLPSEEVKRDLGQLATDPLIDSTAMAALLPADDAAPTMSTEPPTTASSNAPEPSAAQPPPADTATPPSAAPVPADPAAAPQSAPKAAPATPKPGETVLDDEAFFAAADAPLEAPQAIVSHHKKQGKRSLHWLLTTVILIIVVIIVLDVLLDMNIIKLGVDIPHTNVVPDFNSAAPTY